MEAPCGEYIRATGGMSERCLRHDAEVTPDELRLALTDAQGEAVSTCRAVLDEPDASVHADWVDGGLVLTSDLVTIYRRRADHVDAIGLPTLGFREAVQRLEDAPHTTLRLAGVEGAKGYPSCVVFIAPDTLDVVAALAILGPMPLV